MTVRDLMERHRAGVPLERMAIVHGGADPYPRLVHEALEQAGHPQQRCRGATAVGHHGRPHPARGAGPARPRLAPRGRAGLDLRRPDPLRRRRRARPPPGIVISRRGRGHLRPRHVGVAPGRPRHRPRDEARRLRRPPTATRCPSGAASAPSRDLERTLALAEFVTRLADRPLPRRRPHHLGWLGPLGRPLPARPPRRPPRLAGRRRAGPHRGPERAERPGRPRRPRPRPGLGDVPPRPGGRARHTGAPHLTLRRGRAGRAASTPWSASTSTWSIVLGMIEGVFPARPRDDALLPDAERARRRRRAAAAGRPGHRRPAHLPGRTGLGPPAGAVVRPRRPAPRPGPATIAMAAPLAQRHRRWPPAPLQP